MKTANPLSDGLTYRKVKEIMQEVTDQVPALDTPCSDFTLSSAFDGDIILEAKIGRMKIELKVCYSKMSHVEKHIRAKLENIFSATRKRVLHFDEEYFCYKGCDIYEIQAFLNNMTNVVQVESGRYKMPFIHDGELHYPEKGKQCRPWEFHVEDFLPKEIYETFE